jgi:hypothetical protein
VLFFCYILAQCMQVLMLAMVASVGPHFHLW